MFDGQTETESRMEIWTETVVPSAFWRAPRSSRRPAPKRWRCWIWWRRRATTWCRRTGRGSTAGRRQVCEHSLRTVCTSSFESLLVFINGLMDYLKSRIFCQWISWLIASVLTRGLWYLWRIRLTEILPDKMPERLMGNFRDVFIEGTKKKHKIPVSVSGGQSGLIRLIRRGERNVCQPAHTSVFVFTNHRNRMWETLIQFTVQWWMMIKVIWWKILLHLRD